jgi:hypothetical protein
VNHPTYRPPALGTLTHRLFIEALANFESMVVRQALILVERQSGDPEKFEKEGRIASS